MKAAVRTKYGMPGDLTVKEVATPVPKNDELLIKVHACSANRTDCHVLTGKPYVMRLFTGMLKPKHSIIGCDFAGVIEKIGADVRSFKVGERVMGFGGVFSCSSHAEYFTYSEKKAKRSVVTIPESISFTDAAALTEGTFYAASVILKLKPVAGQKALVYGATGAIGSGYVQFLKNAGVYVTAVCGGENAALVRSLGADRIIDYKKEDFTKDHERYDYVFDAVGKSTFLKCKKILKKGGYYAPSDGFINIFFVMINSLMRKKVLFTGPSRDFTAALNFIKEAVEKGNYKPVIDRVYPLDKIVEAFIYVASGQKIGNVLISMD